MNVALKRGPVLTLTTMQRRFLKHALRRLSFGDPALWEQPDGTKWWVSADHRIDIFDVARIATLINNINLVPTDVEMDLTPKAIWRIRRRAEQILNANITPWPDDATPNEVIALQGVGSNVFRAGELGNLTVVELVP